jgi:hypothetical protein
MTFQLLPLKFKPGIYREGTNYSASGTWYDINMARFRDGFPEKIGGWLKAFSQTFLGTARALIGWVLINGNEYLGIGTHLKYYVETGGGLTDITPIRRTVTLGNNPFATTNTSTTVTVTDTGHGAVEDDFVTYSGTTTFAGIPAADFNQEHQIVSIIDSNSYTIVVDTAATSTTSGGGAAVSAAYQINVGLDTTVIGTGWGAGSWGRNTWGSAADVTVAGTQLRLWSHDNFGEDLVINPRGGPIYYWDATTPSSRAVALSSMTGASDVPTIVTEVLVSDVDRHVIAFGANPLGSASQDKLLIRFSDIEDAVDWTPTTENEAGDLRIGTGSQIITAAQTKQEILVWTDISLHSMTFQGPPNIFGIDVLAYNITIMGPNAKSNVDDTVFWMGWDNFYRYNGRVELLPCAVRDYVFSDINREQSLKVHAGSCASFGEVWWFYCSEDAEEVDRYVVYNYLQNIWYYGAMSRTAWLDRGISDYPRATTNNYVYFHEIGVDDGTENPPAAIAAYIESAPTELTPDTGAGSRFAVVNRHLPDVTFNNSTAASPAVSITMTPRNQPGSALSTADSDTVTRTSTVTVEQFTDVTYMRLRGRSMIYKISSSAAGVAWRLGVPRVEVRTDGRR